MWFFTPDYEISPGGLDVALRNPGYFRGKENPMINVDKYIGCFLGLAIGDAYGAPYEGGWPEKALWGIIGKTAQGRKRYTDDTQMSIDIAKSFIAERKINQEHLAQAFAKSYKWSRGYGVSAGKLLKKIRAGAHWNQVNRQKYKEGSLGNGAAMRAPVLAMCYPDNPVLLKENVVKASEITHAHPLAIEGAQLIAFVTSAVLNALPIGIIARKLPGECSDELYLKKVSHCLSFLQSPHAATLQDIRKHLGNGIVATDSCVTAIYFGLKSIHEPLDTLLSDIVKIGGDVDTIGAMATAIWGAANGYKALESRQSHIEDSEMIIELAAELHGISV